MSELRFPPRATFQDARRALAIDALVLVVHDAMFPSVGGKDPGRGSPYSEGARALFEFARDLGFTGVQLGPQGETSAVNQSPYDATVFSRSILSIAFEPLSREPAWLRVLDPRSLEQHLRSAPAPDGRVHYAHVYAEQRRMLGQVHDAFEKRASAESRAEFQAFRSQNASWLGHDEQFEARAFMHGSDDFRTWPDAPLTPGGEAAASLFAFGQWLVHEQHRTLRRTLCGPEWTLYGDLQIGLSPRDRWKRGGMFVSEYAMGAPPSRTDPLGQAWGFPVLDPRSPEADRFLRARARKTFEEYDGLRIDHPHGLVTPWVYDHRRPDALAAVAAGARLFDSPDLSDHPGLAKFAIARAEQLDRAVPRHADGWVRSLDHDQVERYARSVSILLEAARAAGRDRRHVMSEILSTQPYPLQQVMKEFGLGRFLVTQKASLADPRDGYRSENAAPNDWIMVGNHDTAPLSQVLDRWTESGEVAARANYFAERLAAQGEQARFARELAASRARLACAVMAELFVSRARHVTVFASDLFGLRQRYNRPGVVDDVNWTLRIPNDFRSAYALAVGRGDAADWGAALALALRAKSPDTRSRTDLVAALEQQAANAKNAELSRPRGRR